MATARVARPPPGVAFREGAGPGDAPVVTFEAKRAFDAFAASSATPGRITLDFNQFVYAASKTR